MDDIKIHKPTTSDNELNVHIECNCITYTDLKESIKEVKGIQKEHSCNCTLFIKM